MLRLIFRKIICKICYSNKGETLDKYAILLISNNSTSIHSNKTIKCTNLSYHVKFFTKLTFIKEY